MPGNGEFVVLSVKEGYSYTKYHLVQTKGLGQTWVRDAVGKYHVGDTLRISSFK